MSLQKDQFNFLKKVLLTNIEGDKSHHPVNSPESTPDTKVLVFFHGFGYKALYKHTFCVIIVRKIPSRRFLAIFKLSSDVAFVVMVTCQHQPPSLLQWLRRVDLFKCRLETRVINVSHSMWIDIITQSNDG